MSVSSRRGCACPVRRIPSTGSGVSRDASSISCLCSTTRRSDPSPCSIGSSIVRMPRPFRPIRKANSSLWWRRSTSSTWAPRSCWSLTLPPILRPRPLYKRWPRPSSSRASPIRSGWTAIHAGWGLLKAVISPRRCSASVAPWESASWSVTGATPNTMDGSSTPIAGMGKHV